MLDLWRLYFTKLNNIFTSNRYRYLDIRKRNSLFKQKTIYMSIPLGATTSTESNDQWQVSVCLIFIYWRFSVQFVTPTSEFTPFESNGLVYKPHLRFLTQNFGKKVRLIHEFLRYFKVYWVSFVHRLFCPKIHWYNLLKISK